MKYDELLKEAQAVQAQTKGAMLVLASEGEDMGIFAGGTWDGIARLLTSAMLDNPDFADTVIGVAGQMLAQRVTQRAEGMDAKRKAYEETKKPS